MCFFILPEIKGIPLEEIAKIFGETEDIMVFSEDLHIDKNTHELVVEQHNDPNHLAHVATEQGLEGHLAKTDAEKIEHAA